MLYKQVSVHGSWRSLCRRVSGVPPARTVAEVLKGFGAHFDHLIDAGGAVMFHCVVYLQRAAADLFEL